MTKHLAIKISLILLLGAPWLVSKFLPFVHSRLNCRVLRYLLPRGKESRSTHDCPQEVLVLSPVRVAKTALQVLCPGVCQERNISSSSVNLSGIFTVYINDAATIVSQNLGVHSQANKEEATFLVEIQSSDVEGIPSFLMTSRRRTACRTCDKSETLPSPSRQSRQQFHGTIRKRCHFCFDTPCRTSQSTDGKSEQHPCGGPRKEHSRTLGIEFLLSCKSISCTTSSCTCCTRFRLQAPAS